jgi:hypothetical protein
MHNEMPVGVEMPEPLVATRRYSRGGEWRKLTFSRLTPTIVIYSTPMGECGVSQNAAVRMMRLLERNWERA